MLHRVAADGAVATVRTGIGVSNGLAFSPDGATMYFADTPRETVWSYDYDATTGDARNERVFVDFSELPGRPDGACVDEDGGYWIACVGGWAVLRITPAGVVDRRIDLPVARPTMPAFGGPGLATLYVTSIGEGGSRPAIPGQRDPGGLFAIATDRRGLLEPRFGAAA
jgi:sugar lactone lactonase YvrE